MNPPQGTTLRCLVSAMPSALEHPAVIERYLGKECSVGRILGPIPAGDAADLHINRFGVIPKGRASGKWRLITDLSFPDGGSVNDGIDPEHCSFTYTSVDRVAAYHLGLGALMAKADIKAAYRLVPVHPEDRLLLGMQWQGDYLVDAMLPFGFRSAPIIFTAVADALEWCAREKGVLGIDHYLDGHSRITPMPDSPIAIRGGVRSAGSDPCPREERGTHNETGVSGHRYRHHCGLPRHPRGQVDISVHRTGGLDGQTRLPKTGTRVSSRCPPECR